MNKVTGLIFIMLFLFVSYAMGDEFPRRVSFGVRGGVNFSIFSGEDAEHEFSYPKDESGIIDPQKETPRPSVRYIGGAYINIPLSSMFSLQPELLYSQKGSRWKMSHDSEVLKWNDEEVYDIDYLEIPVLFKQKVSEDGYAYAGPLFGFVLNAESRRNWEIKYSIDGEEIVDEGSTTEDRTDELREMDFGLAAGGCYEFGMLVLDGRFTYSLLSIEDSIFDEVRNFALSVSAGMRF